MARNKLLMPMHDPARCTGRTTAIALATIVRAMQGGKSTAYAVDHFNPGTHTSAAHLCGVVKALILRLQLKHIDASIVVSPGPYNNHVRVVCNIWED